MESEGVVGEPGHPDVRRGRPPVENPKRNILTIRGTECWSDWLTAFADHAHMPKTTLIDQALMMYAEAKGFRRPMPKR